MHKLKKIAVMASMMSVLAAGGGIAGKDMDKRSVLFGRAYGELDHVIWDCNSRKYK